MGCKMTNLTENPLLHRSASQLKTLNYEWLKHDHAYECRVVLCAEEDGGFSVQALDLPGVASQGETEKEAIENVRDAFRGVLSAYSDLGQPIPWSDAPVLDDLPSGSKERWVFVNV